MRDRGLAGRGAQDVPGQWRGAEVRPLPRERSGRDLLAARYRARRRAAYGQARDAQQRSLAERPALLSAARRLQRAVGRERRSLAGRSQRLRGDARECCGAGLCAARAGGITASRVQAERRGREAARAAGGVAWAGAGSADSTRRPAPGRARSPARRELTGGVRLAGAKARRRPGAALGRICSALSADRGSTAALARRRPLRARRATRTAAARRRRAARTDVSHDDRRPGRFGAAFAPLPYRERVRRTGRMLKPLRAALEAWTPRPGGSLLDPLVAITAAWSQLVGPELARVTRPTAIVEETLVVTTSSSA